jgi:hypothetical protein
LIGTLAQFNTALSDGSFATLAGTETLTNKTLTAPTISAPVVTDGTFADAELNTPTINDPDGIEAEDIAFDRTVTDRLDATDLQAAVDEMVGFFSVTLSIGDWSGEDTVEAVKTVSGIKATDRPIIDVDLSSVAFEDVEEALTAWGQVYRVAATGADELTFFALETPDVELTVSVKVVR